MARIVKRQSASEVSSASPTTAPATTAQPTTVAPTTQPVSTTPPATTQVVPTTSPNSPTSSPNNVPTTSPTSDVVSSPTPVVTTPTTSFTPTSTQVSTTVVAQIPTTFASTDQAGSTVVLTTTFSTAVPTTTTITSTPTPAPASSTPIGAIVGGVIGGVAALVALALLGLWCIRRRSSEKEDFDGNFDPDRITQGRGPATLDADHIAPFLSPTAAGSGTDKHEGRPEAYTDNQPYHDQSFSPYAQAQQQPWYGHPAPQQMHYEYGGYGPGYADQGYAQQALAQHAPGAMQQAHPQAPVMMPVQGWPGYGEAPERQYTQYSAGESHLDPHEHPTSPSTTASVYSNPSSLGPVLTLDRRGTRTGPSPPGSTVSSQAKEREAFRLTLATPLETHERDEGAVGEPSGQPARAESGAGRESVAGTVTSTGTATGTGVSRGPSQPGLVVHQDAGPAEQEEEVPQEVPPSYDSIQQRGDGRA